MAYPYPYQPPPPAFDPFRDYYRNQLAQLTWNSKPIINNLTIIAGDRRDKGDWAGCQAIAWELDEAIRRSPPHEKLSKLYLLDSISKNIGHPFSTTYFPPFIPDLFRASYFAVDGVTKHKMEELLDTWKVAGPGQTDLFGEGVRIQIEGSIFGGSGAAGFAAPAPAPLVGYPPMVNPGTAGYPAQQHIPPVLYPGPRVGTPSFDQPELRNPSKGQVLEQLERALEGRRVRIARDAYDGEARGEIDILSKIHKMLKTSLITRDDLLAIQSQLSDMDATGPDATAPAAASHIGSPYGQHQPPAQPQSTSSSTATLAVPPIDFGNLFKNLAAAGVISSNPSTPHGGPSGGREGSVLSDAQGGRGGSVLSDRDDLGMGLQSGRGSVREGSVDSRVGGSENGGDEGDGMERYEEMVLAMNVQLTLEDLQKERSFDPTSHLPNRCSQCSARFAAGKSGRERLQAHLDWHFRRNRKEREGEGRGGNRRWLPRAEFWISDVVSTDPSPDGHVAPGTTVVLKPGANKQVDPAVRAERRAALQKKWVKVPSDPSKAATPCPICKERFVNEYEEEEEEWIWRNAVKAEGQIFHATCRADAMSTAVASRLLAAEGSKKEASAPPSRGRSPRGTTPQPPSSSGVVSDSPLKKVSTLVEETASTLNANGVKEEVGDDGIPVQSVNDLKRKAVDRTELEREIKREKVEGTDDA